MNKVLCSLVVMSFLSSTAAYSLAWPWHAHTNMPGLYSGGRVKEANDRLVAIARLRVKSAERLEECIKLSDLSPDEKQISLKKAEEEAYHERELLLILLFQGEDIMVGDQDVPDEVTAQDRKNFSAWAYKQDGDAVSVELEKSLCAPCEDLLKERFATN